MTLKNRIALTFSALTTLLLGGVLTIIYLFAARYTEREFIERLEDRALIAAQTLLEEDELRESILEQLRERHMQTLPEEKEYIFHLDQRDSLPRQLIKLTRSIDLLDRIREKERVGFSRSTISLAGIKYEDNQGTFAVIVTAKDLYGQSKLKNLQLVMLVALLTYLVVVFFVGSWYAQSVLNPLSAIIARMQEINTSNLHLRLDEKQHQKDELNQLTKTFNRMLDRLETSVEAQNQFVGNASHQLKNPLTAILGIVETTLGLQRDDAGYRDSLRRIEEEASRLRTLVLSLLRLAHTGGNQEENTFADWRIDEILFELVDEFHDIMPDRRLRIDFSGFPAEADLLTVKAHRNLLKIALSNIVENAYKFSGNQDVTINLSATSDAIHLDISDQGIGIPESDQPSIFHPFFRSENARHLPGYGMGLPLVDKIIKMHHGLIQVTSKPGKGTVFSITLPRQFAFL